MKSQLLKLAAISLVLTSYVYSQEKPKAYLFDEFSKLNCESVLARTDAFILEIQNNPALEGNAIIDLGNENIQEGIKREEWIKGNLKFRGFPLERIKVIRTKSSKNYSIQFWLSPNNKTKPKYTEKSWDFAFPKTKRPFIFSMNYNDAGLCPGIERLNINYFAEFMKANPKARSNIVIKTPSNKYFAKEKQALLKLIKDKYKINNKIRFFRVRKQQYWTSETPEIEVWILP